MIFNEYDILCVDSSIIKLEHLVKHVQQSPSDTKHDKLAYIMS